MTVNSWAWVPRSEVLAGLPELKKSLTIIPRKIPGYSDDDESPDPLFLYKDDEKNDRFGMARQFFMMRKKLNHEIDYELSGGITQLFSGPVAFDGVLREEQQLCVDYICAKFLAGCLGGIIQAVPGFGKTIVALAIAAKLEVPTLVIVHKEFLMTQWRDRILGNTSKGLKAFVPNARVGYVQQDVCDYAGKTFVIAMIQSLTARQYDMLLYGWPGLVIVDEVHRIGAPKFSLAAPLFPCRWRLGLSATPHRKDGADNVFKYHIGSVIFKAKEKRLLPRIRKVFTRFRIVKTPYVNPSLLRRPTIVRFMCANEERNRLIIGQLILAVKAGRKIMLLSERLNHLARLHRLFEDMWTDGTSPAIGYYVGGMKEEQLSYSEKCQIILATWQMVKEGLDIPPLDTLFMATPSGDVTQAVGRILRPHEGKKDPVVVDFIDRLVTMCQTMSESRDRQYASMCRA